MGLEDIKEVCQRWSEKTELWGSYPWLLEELEKAARDTTEEAMAERLLEFSAQLEEWGVPLEATDVEIETLKTALVGSQEEEERPKKRLDDVEEICEPLGNHDVVSKPCDVGTRPVEKEEDAVLIGPAHFETDHGNFEFSTYETKEEDGHRYGVTTVLDFIPTGKLQDATIRFVQIIKTELGGRVAPASPFHRNRMTTNGYYVDRGLIGGTCPYYGVDKIDEAENGHLKDTPQLPGCGCHSGQTFETAAIVFGGNFDGMYCGSVHWGWKIDGEGTFKRLERRASKGVSEEFKLAIGKWNAVTCVPSHPDPPFVKTKSDPTIVYAISEMGTHGELPSGVTVEVSYGNYQIRDDKIYLMVTCVQKRVTLKGEEYEIPKELIRQVKKFRYCGKVDNGGVSNGRIEELLDNGLIAVDDLCNVTEGVEPDKCPVP